MQFKIFYLVGKSQREAVITAGSAEEAECRADEKYPGWVDIFYPKQICFEP